MFLENENMGKVYSFSLTLLGPYSQNFIFFLNYLCAQ